MTIEKAIVLALVLRGANPDLAPDMAETILDSLEVAGYRVVLDPGQPMTVLGGDFAARERLLILASHLERAKSPLH